MSNSIKLSYNNQISAIDKFAPVIIPTLCRFEHFKRCIESLMSCTHADKTDVYVALDYPSKESHWDGYNKISEFLDYLNVHNGFKSLEIVRREKNYGFGENGNATTLIRSILEKYDSYIFSEDDNVFSPAFLDFVNKGLIKFKDDKTVLAICGYQHPYNFKFTGNTFFRQSVDFNAWGYGIWKDRYEDLCQLSPSWFKKQATLRNLYNIKTKNGNDRAFHLFEFSRLTNNQFRRSDIVYSVYAYLSKRDIIMPYKTMVRNTGFDNSGESFIGIDPKIAEIFTQQQIYDKVTIDLMGSGKECYEINRKIYKTEGLGNFSNCRLFIIIAKFLVKSIMAKHRGK